MQDTCVRQPGTPVFYVLPQPTSVGISRGVSKVARCEHTVVTFLSDHIQHEMYEMRLVRLRKKYDHAVTFNKHQDKLWSVEGAEIAGCRVLSFMLNP